MQRRCGIEDSDVYGRATSVVWEAYEENKTATEIRYSDGYVMGKVSMRVYPSFAVTDLVTADDDVYLIGKNCIYSVSIAQERCIRDLSFESVAADVHDGSVYVMGRNGDTYVFHVVPRKGMRALLGREASTNTWQFLQAVPATSFIDTTCMTRSIGLGRDLKVDGMVRRVFENGVISSFPPPKTSSGVWLPYMPYKGVTCDILVESCKWYEYGDKCAARRRCKSLREAPSAEKDYVCGKRSVVKQVRKRREDYCNEADFPPPINYECETPKEECTVVRETVTNASKDLVTNEGLELVVVTMPTRPPIACEEGYFGENCLPCARCGKGTYLVKECTKESDVVCAACKRGTYQPLEWHLERACHVSNGCEGGSRVKNGVCESSSFNVNSIYAIALPLYGFFTLWGTSRL